MNMLVLAVSYGLGVFWTIVIGGIAGWLAGQITRRRGFGVLRNIVIGVIGSVLGGLLFEILGLQVNSLVGHLVMGTVGALVLLYLINSLARGR